MTSSSSSFYSFCLFTSSFAGVELPPDQAPWGLLLLRCGSPRGQDGPRQLLRRARPPHDQGHQPGQEKKGVGELLYHILSIVSLLHACSSFEFLPLLLLLSLMCL